MKSESKKSFVRRAIAFYGEVKQEVKRVTWPSRKETTTTTIVVFIFSAVASVFFVLVDSVIIKVLDFIKGL